MKGKGCRNFSPKKKRPYVIREVYILNKPEAAIWGLDVTQMSNFTRIYKHCNSYKNTRTLQFS